MISITKKEQLFYGGALTISQHGDFILFMIGKNGI